MCCQTRPHPLGVDNPHEELHFRDLFVNFLHELDDKVYQLMLQHFLGMGIRNQEGYVVSLFGVSI